ncbi:MAG: inner membrane-spanning protein YciB [Sediminimonas sp.]|uniref:inner membrane-spanning protein YciB n=1 Tax=Sediminimonas sp. TaxID=2823379 RepID=UPI00286FEA30|nr:inner membrane-spanning protein YciB [Sediminimonas sp.]MDR9484570.1 inner membrane-spanning protein YciB [Sediminimonas sp.]
MSRDKINPMLKTGLELGPIVVFFVAYVLLKDNVYSIGGRTYDGFILVTAGFIPLLTLTTAALWRLTGKLSKMQLVTLVLVIVFGGLSVWLNDDRFFKMKPTMIYLIFGGILGAGLLRGRSYLQSVMDEVMPLQREGWMILTRRLMIFFFALAIANEAVWRLMSTEAWVYFKTFGLSAAVFGFFITQGRVFSDYGIDEGGGDK